MVSRTLLLDAGPLGIVTNPKRTPVGDACVNWLTSHIANGSRIIIPEIADYEVRRELLRAQKKIGLALLDAMILELEYLPLNTVAMRHAARLWAHARQTGQPTAGDKSVDGDMILIGQALSLEDPSLVIATTNVLTKQ